MLKCYKTLVRIMGGFKPDEQDKLSNKVYIKFAHNADEAKQKMDKLIEKLNEKYKFKEFAIISYPVESKKFII